jgi:tRNA/tmRNA/rRNA uracil-C5-methylase (TrmA/RlmC/RlmD family)
MPEEGYRNSLFDIPLILKWLDLKHISDPMVEIDCRHGTFTLPIAKEIKNQIYAFDIEPAMIQRPETYVQEEGIHNVQFIQRDIVDQGTGLKQGHEVKYFL